MDDLPKNMTKRGGGSKHLWHRESACPHAAGTGHAGINHKDPRAAEAKFRHFISAMVCIAAM
jgi:hypothetical protein